jgi:hypothetical protein
VEGKKEEEEEKKRKKKKKNGRMRIVENTMSKRKKE